MIEPNYVMKGFVERVIDGDSVIMTVSPAFKIYLKNYKFRFYGIDTAELNSKDPGERDLAKQAKTHVVSAIEGKDVIIKTIKNTKGAELIDSFGRYLVIIYYMKDEIQIDLNFELLELGLAKAWA